jgi:hypothetical protein
MTVSAMSTAASHSSAWALAAAVVIFIFAISLPFVVVDPGRRDSSEVQFVGP